MTAKVRKFREAYDVLQRHADTLRNQREPNIDDLLRIVNESIGAYQVCKERIEAVEKALEQALGSVGIESSGATDSPGGRTRGEAEEDASDFEDPEDDHDADDADDSPPF